jgi:hypothetical protein
MSIATRYTAPARLEQPLELDLGGGLGLPRRLALDSVDAAALAYRNHVGTADHAKPHEVTSLGLHGSYVVSPMKNAREA